MDDGLVQYELPKDIYDAWVLILIVVEVNLVLHLRQGAEQGRSDVLILVVVEDVLLRQDQ